LLAAGNGENRAAARDGLKDATGLRRHRQSKLTSGTTLRGHGHVNVLIPCKHAGGRTKALPRGVSVELSPESSAVGRAPRPNPRYRRTLRPADAERAGAARASAADVPPEIFDPADWV